MSLDQLTSFVKLLVEQDRTWLVGEASHLQGFGETGQFTCQLAFISTAHTSLVKAQNGISVLVRNAFVFELTPCSKEAHILSILLVLMSQSVADSMQLEQDGHAVVVQILSSTDLFELVFHQISVRIELFELPFNYEVLTSQSLQFSIHRFSYDIHLKHHLLDLVFCRLTKVLNLFLVRFRDSKHFLWAFVSWFLSLGLFLHLRRELFRASRALGCWCGGLLHPIKEVLQVSDLKQVI